MFIGVNSLFSMCLGCFFFVGGALPGDTLPHHKSVFDFDEVRFYEFRFILSVGFTIVFSESGSVGCVDLCADYPRSVESC